MKSCSTRTEYKKNGPGRAFQLGEFCENLQPFIFNHSFTSVQAMLVFLFLLVVAFLDVNANKCIVQGVYLQTTGRDTRPVIKTSPENGTLKEVGDKKCGFIIKYEKSPYESMKVEYVAVPTKTNSSEEFCSLWKDYAICVCSFYGCNSVSGAFFETILNYWREGEVEGEDNNEVIRDEDFAHDALGTSMINFQNLVEPGGRMPRQYSLFIFRDSPMLIPSMKKRYPWFFPNETRKQELMEEGNPLLATTTTPIPPPISLSRGPPSQLVDSHESSPSSPQPVQLSNSIKDKNNAEDCESKSSGISLWIVIALIALIIILLASIIVIFVIFHKMLKAANPEA